MDDRSKFREAVLEVRKITIAGMTTEQIVCELSPKYLPLEINNILQWLSEVPRVRKAERQIGILKLCLWIHFIATLLITFGLSLALAVVPLVLVYSKNRFRFEALMLGLGFFLAVPARFGNVLGNIPEIFYALQRSPVIFGWYVFAVILGLRLASFVLLAIVKSQVNPFNLEVNSILAETDLTVSGRRDR
jgi:hypothetical protein